MRSECQLLHRSLFLVPGLHYRVTAGCENKCTACSSHWWHHGGRCPFHSMSALEEEKNLQWDKQLQLADLPWDRRQAKRPSCQNTSPGKSWKHGGSSSLTTSTTCAHEWQSESMITSWSVDLKLFCIVTQFLPRQLIHDPISSIALH